MSLDEIGATLRELWISYNQIEKLDGLNPCVKLEVLYISNNKIANWGEVQKLSSLNVIKSVLLVGNPIYDESSQKDQHMQILKQMVEDELKRKIDAAEGKASLIKEAEAEALKQKLDHEKNYWIYRTTKRLPMLEQCDCRLITPNIRNYAELLE